MATKVVVISDTRIGGKHVDAGTVLTLDEQTNEGRTTLGELNAAARIVIHGSEGHELWKADQEKLQASAEAAAKKSAKGKAEKAE